MAKVIGLQKIFIFYLIACLQPIIFCYYSVMTENNMNSDVKIVDRHFFINHIIFSTIFVLFILIISLMHYVEKICICIFIFYIKTIRMTTSKTLKFVRKVVALRIVIRTVIKRKLTIPLNSASRNG